MKRALLVGLLAPSMLGALVWAGCALVIDLGDQALLRVDAAIVDDSAAVAPEDAGDDAPAIVCGLPPVKNATCADCSVSYCCDIDKVCAADPLCVQALACIQNCLAQLSCVSQCLGEADAAINAVVGCSTTNCTDQCTPPSDCQNLGACASLLDPDAGKLLRDIAKERILELDPIECEKQRKAIGNVLDASLCH